MSKLTELNEEFNNFMHKVTQVSNIVQKLASNDKKVQEIGNLEAKEYLGEDREVQIDEDNVLLKVESSKTIINRKALYKNDNPDTQSPDAFMEEISKDADRRYHNKCVRRERMQTFRKQATLAFRRDEFEKALTLYNKAIEQIRDSCTLYINRAVTLLKLKLYEKSADDCKMALRLNENSLKARLLLAKSHFLSNNSEEYQKDVEEAKSRNPDQAEFIQDFVKELEGTC